MAVVQQPTQTFEDIQSIVTHNGLDLEVHVAGKAPVLLVLNHDGGWSTETMCVDPTEPSLKATSTYRGLHRVVATVKYGDYVYVAQKEPARIVVLEDGLYVREHTLVKDVPVSLAVGIHCIFVATMGGKILTLLHPDELQPDRLL